MLRHDSLEERIRALQIGTAVTVRISPRARRLSLRVDAAKRGVELVLPRRFLGGTALAFVSSHRGWIAARVAAMPPPRPLRARASVPAFGGPHRICRQLDPEAP